MLLRSLMGMAGLYEAPTEVRSPHRNHGPAVLRAGPAVLRRDGLIIVEKICGPDVTDYVVKELMNVYASGSPLSVRGGARIDLRSRPKKDMEAKPVAIIPNECPVECAESITLCGLCVSDQIPGNTALGVFFGAAVARVIGAAAAKLKGETDSDEDIASYDMGDSLRSVMMRNRIIRNLSGPSHAGPNVESWSEKAEQNVKEAVCALIKKAVGDKKIKTMPCTKCPKTWSR